MGREIRRVPPNWQHPQETKYNLFKRIEEMEYKPMHDRVFAPTMREWIAEWENWESGWRPDYYEDDEYHRNMPYWEYAGGPPDPEFYRPDWPEGSATWWQVYQTVSEGTPVTPPFATREELVDYLVANGDFWDQKRREEGESCMPCGPWPHEQARRFVFEETSAPTFVVLDGKVMSGVEFLKEKTS